MSLFNYINELYLCVLNMLKDFYIELFEIIVFENQSKAYNVT